MAGELAGRRIPICGSEVIHGKTGPPPRGAVLFGPFSYAYKKKDEGKGGIYGGGERDRERRPLKSSDQLSAVS